MSSIKVGYTTDSKKIEISPRMANRHGLIAGATGTGKTVSLQVLAEQFSSLGVPVFTADIKGDLSGLAKAGTSNPRIADRIKRFNITDWQPRNYPVVFWDLWGQKGHPVRATISEMGAILLSRILNLNETQEQVLQLAFQIADDQGLLLLDTKDLKELLNWVGQNASELRSAYGNISSQTIGTIQRNLLNLDNAGGNAFFGEPALKLEHLQQRDFSGNGVISILDATKLLQDSRAYSTFLLWLLSELFEQLPEVGDLDKPKMVFFFDEAHLLFKDAPTSLVEKIEQVVRLIRSKGVGIYFVTQNPLDIPETVLGQLGNRIQHALRAFTPADQKAVRAAAQTFRANPNLDTEKAISELEVGEALVSVLDSEGRPTPVERVFIAPPNAQIGIISEPDRLEMLSRSPIKGLYEQLIDRESAFEILKKRQTENAAKVVTAGSTSATSTTSSWGAAIGGIFAGNSRRQGLGEAMVKSVVRTVGSNIGRQIVRGIMGSILGGRR